MALSFDKVNKIITIPSPDTEITIQNLLNGIREWEDELASMDMPVVASCAGKEPLGGGVLVGLTLTLLDDWQVAFEARPGPAYIQCKVSGGNIVAVNVNGPVYPTAFTQVLITASSSATQSDLAAIQYSSYGGRVSMDINSGITGTAYPVGNVEYPVNNFADTLAIAFEKGFTNIEIRTSTTINTGDFSGFHIYGRSHVNTVLTIESPADVSDVHISHLHIEGVLDGGTEINDCVIGDLLYFNGHIHDSGLLGTIILSGNKKALISNCNTINQDSPPVIDMGGSGQALAMPNYSGMITFKNLSDPTQEITLGLNAGTIILDETITAGTVVLAGIGLLIDNSVGSPPNLNINTDGLMNRELIADASWDVLYYNANSAWSGTDFPVGTLSHPVNNITDLLAISAKKSIKSIKLLSSITLDQNAQGFAIKGGAGIVFNPNGFSVYGCIIDECRVTGNFIPEPLFFRVCSLTGITNLTGSFVDCWFLDTTPITVAANQNVLMSTCLSSVPGNNSPVLDYSNGNISFNMRGYSGDIRVINSTDPDNISTFEFLAGKFNFDATTNTAGDFHIRGVIDTSGIDINSTASVSYTGSVTTNREQQYKGVVYLDVINGVSGSKFPIGLTTKGRASNNLADALAIATQYNCDIIMLDGALTITTGQDISGYNIKSERSSGSILTFESGAILNGVNFENLTLLGDMAGSTDCNYHDCTFNETKNISGISEHCYMVSSEIGDLSIEAGGYFSAIELVFEGDFTSIDMQSTTNIIFSADINSGYVLIKNLVAGSLVEINMRGGEFEFDVSCTGGDFYAEGYGTLYNDSASLDSLGIITKENHLLALETIPIPVWEYDRDA